MRRVTGFGRQRLSFYLACDEGIKLSPNTIRHFLRRNKQPFSIAQVDTKDVLDKGTLGTKRWHHLLEYDLPRYQWTFCEARSRFRFLTGSEELTLTN